MSGNYIYFISSLPLLLFGAKPPFSREGFFELCAEHVSSDEAALLEIAPRLRGPGSGAGPPALKGWLAFDTALRNALVKIRSARRKPGKEYARGDGYADPSIVRTALKAHRSPSLLEAERMLDEARWQALDNLEVGNYFNIDYLIIYTLKLSILERWEHISAADGEQLVEETLPGERK